MERSVAASSLAFGEGAWNDWSCETRGECWDEDWDEDWDGRAPKCDDADADIEISEVSPAVFKEVLRFTYCDELSSPDVLSTLDGARAVLKAADRFGVTRLKQLAEIELATRHLSVESAADLLLLADAHSCPQLKESATELFVSKAAEVMATEGWARLSKSADLYGHATENKVGDYLWRI